MDKNFEALKYSIDYVYGDSGFHDKRKAADALVALWDELRKQGVKPGDFARSALLVSGYVMTCHDTLPEVLRFVETMEATARDKLDNLKRNWPNVLSDDPWPKGLYPEDEK